MLPALDPLSASNVAADDTEDNFGRFFDCKSQLGDAEEGYIHVYKNCDAIGRQWMKLHSFVMFCGSCA